MTHQTANSITFAAPDQTKQTGLLSVAYLREDDQLTIDVGLAEGGAFKAVLQRR